MKKIKLMADYFCYPLWSDSGDPEEHGDINPDDLPISDLLKKDLEKWADEYDGILNMADPASSGFESSDARRLFDEKGKSLHKRLKLELGENYRVRYKGPYSGPIIS